MKRFGHRPARITTAVAILSLTLPAMALADSPPPIIPTQPPGTPSSLESLIQNLFNIGVTAGGIIFLVLFFIGAIGYLTSAGDEKGTGEAKKRMVDAIVGLVLVLGAWTIARFIGNALHAPGF